MRKLKITDRFHWHEALDRTDIIAQLVQQYLCDNPAISQTDELKGIATTISNDLGVLYQRIGELDPHWRSKKAKP